MIWGYWGILRPKNHTRNLNKLPIIFKLYQVFIQKFCPKMFQYLHIIYFRHILKAFLPLPKRFYTYFYKFSKNQFYSFFSSSDTPKSHHAFGYHAAGINSLLISFLNALCCVYSSYNAWSKRTVDKIYSHP